jgi:hypothetical protein
MVLSHDEQGLRATTGDRRSLHLRGDESLDAQAFGSLMRLFGQSRKRSSQKFAPNTCDCHHTTAGQASSEDYRKLRSSSLPDYCVWAVSVTDYRVRDTAGLMALVSPRRFVEDGEMKEQRKGVRIEEG